MATCKTLVRTSITSIASTLRSTTTATFSPTLCFSHRLPSRRGLRLINKFPSKTLASIPVGPPDPSDEGGDEAEDNVESLLTRRRDDVASMMKMERGPINSVPGRRFPYLNRFRRGGAAEHHLTGGEVIEAVEPHIMGPRMERFRSVVSHRSYSVCLVVEGLSDFGNVSAAFRSADALGFQSVHVVSCDSSKRCNDH